MFRFSLDKKARVRRDELLAKLRAIPEDADYVTATPMVIEAFRGVGYDLWQWFDEGPGYSTAGDRIFAKVRQVRNSPEYGGLDLFKAINEKPKKVRATRKQIREEVERRFVDGEISEQEYDECVAQMTEMNRKS